MVYRCRLGSLSNSFIARVVATPGGVGAELESRPELQLNSQYFFFVPAVLLSIFTFIFLPS